MANIEREGEGIEENLIEILARFQLGQIKRDSMDENNQAILSYYLGLMAEDSTFRDKVVIRKNEIVLASKNGGKVPLYTNEELAPAKKHKKIKPTSYERAYQPGLFGDPSREKEIIGFEDILNPERKLDLLHKKMQGRYSSGNSRLIAKEVQQKKTELRSLIGLPVARGKDKHTNDDFYKYLVKKVVGFDTFGIFNEYDRVITNTPPELETKINQVKGLMSELLDENLNLRQKYQKLYQFEDDFKNDWEK